MASSFIHTKAMKFAIMVRKTDNTESSYSNAVLWMKFPLDGTSQFTDEIKSDFKFNGASGTVKDNCTSKVLGVSTLTLPNGKKYENAMLVETTKAMEGEVFILKATITEYGKYWWGRRNSTSYCGDGEILFR